MKIKLSKVQWEVIGKKTGWIKEARRKDSHGIPLAYSEKYVLKKIKHGIDDPYFFGNGSLHSPEMVMDFSDAAQISGGQLEDLAWDWTRDWVAIAVNTPSAEIVFGKKPRIAAQIPNTQNQNPDEPNFAVDLAGTKRSMGSSKGKINNEIHSLGNYFLQIPTDQIWAILKKYNVIVVQEDGTKWSGFIGPQGECGSDKARDAGSMRFDLAVKIGDSYVISTNSLIMTVCTMPSGKLEVIAYIS